jgi:anti-sigma-K factor RskA
MPTVERSEVEPGNPHRASDSAPAAGRNGGDSGPRFWRRTAFWRALAGMGFALAIAAVIVAVEFSAALIHRTHWMSRRIAHLNVESRHLKSRIGIAEQKLAAMRAANARDGALKRILTAPDLRLVRLSPPAAGHAEPAQPTAAGSAVIAISDSQKLAVLQTDGLAPSPEGRVYRVWWMPRRGAAVAAGQFRAGAGGDVTVTVALPPKGAASAAIYEEDASATGAPAGAPILRSAAAK